MGRKNGWNLKKVSIIVGIIIGIIVIGSTIINAISSFGVDNFKVKTTYEAYKDIEPRVTECEKKDIKIFEQLKNLETGQQDQKEKLEKMDEKLDRILGR